VDECGRASALVPCETKNAGTPVNATGEATARAVAKMRLNMRPLLSAEQHVRTFPGLAEDRRL
jgi:hypothetical protein